MNDRWREERHGRGASDEEASYVCDSCGEDIVVPIDPTGGSHQQYVEDCPVCCVPHVLTVDIDPDYGVTISAEAE